MYVSRLLKAELYPKSKTGVGSLRCKKSRSSPRSVKVDAVRAMDETGEEDWAGG